MNETDTPSSTPIAERAPASNLPEVTVSELAGGIKRTLEDRFGRVRVRGELSRVTIAKSGHMYTDLKDEGAVLSMVMWKGQVGRLSFKPEEGLEVIAEGRISTFPGRSNYQLIADTLEPAGAGALMALLDARRRKLAAEGLFDQSRKQALPFLPRVIGVVTSPTGAVIRDILHRVADRFAVHVLIWPVLVQGDKAAEQISVAVNGFNALAADGPIPRPDLLIVARGGGSIEDLWPFNEEVVVRAVAASTIPVISAVGHETDWTLCDAAADVRAPTPTGAAEMALPVLIDLAATLDDLGMRLRQGLRRRLLQARTELRAIEARLPRPERLLETRRQRFDFAAERLRGGLSAAVQKRESGFSRIAGRLRPEALALDLTRRQRDLARTSERLTPAFARRMDVLRQRLDAAFKLARSLSFEATLARGFALIEREDGTLLKSAADGQAGEAVRLRFADGARAARLDPQSSDTPPDRPPPSASKPPSRRAVRDAGSDPGRGTGPTTKQGSRQGDLF